jgi:hypothetical protein
MIFLLDSCGIGTFSLFVAKAARPIRLLWGGSRVKEANDEAKTDVFALWSSGNGAVSLFVPDWNAHLGR